MRLRNLAIYVALLAIAGATLGAASASAAPAAHWQILTQPAPTYFHPGDASDFYEVVAVNDGSAPSVGRVTLSDTLPAGLGVTSVTGAAGVNQGVQYAESQPMDCVTTGISSQTVECTAERAVPIGERVAVKVGVEVPSNASGPLGNTATISGGGAPEAASVDSRTPVVDPSVPVPYGVDLVAEATSQGVGLETQAGAHPFSFSTILATHVARVAAAESCSTQSGPSGVQTPGCAELVSASRDIEVQLPPGLIGNPQNLPRCTHEQFYNGSGANCPASTQVGGLYTSFFGSLTGEEFIPIYNLVPPPGEPALFGFVIGFGQAHVPMRFHVRADGDYGITVGFSNITNFDAIRLAELSIWGVPADPAHDEKRYSIIEGCEAGASGKKGCPAGVPAAPLLSMPTSCLGARLPMPSVSDAWARPGAYVDADREPGLAGMTNCARVPFEPTLEASPTTEVADSPTGLHVDLHLPQPESPGGLAEAHLRDAVVTLPAGLTVNPSSANGLAGCEPDRIDLHGEAPAACPDASKIGTVEVDTPVLDHPLPGAVYLAQPYDNPFGSLLAIYVAVYDPLSGVAVKLAGRVDIGAEGQLTTTFDDNPQLPFEDFRFDFFAGPRAPLKTPEVCGVKATTSRLTPWSAPESGPASTLDSYTTASQPGGGSCPTAREQQPNSPFLEAGTQSPVAGAYSPFVLHLDRGDGSQRFSSLTVSPPPGLLGRLAGIPYCSDAAIAGVAGKTGAEEKASPSCPAASRVGSVTVGAGAGPAPFYVSGNAYLAGPYKGAPLSLALVTPAVAGPFDLGAVVVRSALEVDPESAQITVKSDPIPPELKNIPLDVRSIAVRMDRPDFTLNPTSCEATLIGASERSTVGQTASLANRFQVGGCDALAFKPKLALSLRGSTGRLGHPGLKAVVTYPKQGAYANIRRAQVNLPHSEFLDQGNLNKTCTKPLLLRGQCPKTAIYGRAKAWTPLLEKPLQGPVYLVGGYGYKLPALIAELNGQIRVVLKGRVDSGKNKGIRNTFEAVPDAPVSRFVLELKGGKKYGLLENSESLCRKPRHALVRFTGQNGQVQKFRPLIANRCGTKTKGKR